MMIKEFYLSEWGGDDDSELDTVLKRAEMIVDGEIFLSGLTVRTVPEKLRERVFGAVCAQAEFIIAAGGTAALSENTGGSVSLGKFSYSDGAGSSSESTSACALCLQTRNILEPTGLLYKGAVIM